MDIASQIEDLEQRAIALKRQVSLGLRKINQSIRHLLQPNKLNSDPSVFRFSLQKKYLEALKKYEEVILLKRDTYGDRSETVSLAELDGFFINSHLIKF